MSYSSSCSLMDMLSRGTSAKEQYCICKMEHEGDICIAQQMTETEERIFSHTLTEHCLQGLERHGV